MYRRGNQCWVNLYWYARMQERQPVLGTNIFSAFFITHSIADNHWEETPPIAAGE